MNILKELMEELQELLTADGLKNKQKIVLINILKLLSWTRLLWSFVKGVLNAVRRYLRREKSVKVEKCQKLENGPNGPK